MLFRCKQGPNSAEAKRLQVTEVRKKVKSEVPSLFLPYCLSGPSLFSIQKAHGRKKKKPVSFFHNRHKEVYHKQNIGRSQEIAVALTLINVTVLKILFPSRAVTL